MEQLILVLVAAATSAAMKGLTVASSWLAGTAPLVRTVIVAVLGFGVAWLSGFVGIPLPADPTGWDATVVNGLLTALSAMGLHAATKAVTKTP